MTIEEEIKILEELLKVEEKQRIIEAKKGLLSFTTYTKHNYKTNWHHKYTAEKLDDFISGKIKKLMIYMPPQHGKTELGTRRTIAKVLGAMPNKKVAVCAYNHTVAAGFNRDIQRIIDSEEYQELYPETKLNGANARTTGTWLRNSDEFQIVNHEGGLVSVGVGGGLTSKTVDMLVIDDVYKDHKEAWSPVCRDNVKNWYDAVAETRLHNDSQILIIFTRWHEMDLAGYIIENEPKEDWVIVKFPAIKENDDDLKDPRKIGDALWPERHCLEKILRIKKKNQIIFESLYQQNPKPSKGLMYPQGFKTYDKFKEKELIKLGCQIRSYTDTADKGSDHLMSYIFYEYEKQAFVKDVIYTKEDMSVTIPLWSEKHFENKVNDALIEYNNGGHPFKIYAEDKLKEKFDYHACYITGFHQSENKIMRIISQAHWVQENVFFPENWHILWPDLFVHLNRYQREGKNAHDDAEDGITGVAEMIVGKKEAEGYVVTLDDNDYEDTYNDYDGGW